MAEEKDLIGELNQEIIDDLLDLRNYLEKRVKELEEETENLRILSKLIEDEIVSKSFKEAGELQKPSQKIVATSPGPDTESTPLKTSRGTPLAEMLVSPKTIRILPAENLKLSVRTPPFQSFFISRILDSMREKDGVKARSGELLPEDTLSYKIVTDEEIVREIIIRNYGGDKRVREIKSTCRWTMEKMYQRTRLQAS